MTLHDSLRRIGEQAAAAARETAQLSARRKNLILTGMAEGLERQRDALFAVNARDVAAATEAGLPAPLVNRLTLDERRLAAMVKGLRDVAALPDPVGARISRWLRPNGLVIQKIRVPIGVIAIVYESRPTVTADTAALCLKSGNAIILRGGTEALHTNQALAETLVAAGRSKGLAEHAIQFISTTDRNAVRELVQLEGLVDLVIPRGGESLIRAVTSQARVPVIKHYTGVCHIYVDASADADMALRIIENAKCSAPAVCNAVEKVLIHAALAPAFLPRLAERLRARNVELRGDEAARAIAPDLKPATDDDWTEEYLDLILAIKVVPDAPAAVAHVNRFGSHHSDAIVAADPAAQKLFTREVDSAAVYVNASTRFTDGGEFGMGAEIGISTDKLHARGPMGLEELTSYKYVVLGEGQIRE